MTQTPLATVLSSYFVLLPLLAAQIPTRELSFTGGVERVMEHSISILLADGRLIDAKLPDKGRQSAAELSDNYKLGDQVTIQCKFIPAAWDEASHMYRMLELQKIRLIRHPNPEEFSTAVKSRDWRLPGNLLQAPPGTAPTLAVPKPAPQPAPSTGADPDPQAFLEQARKVILDRAAHLPNFIADEVADCYSSTTNPPEWRHMATIQSEVTFKGDGETRKQRTRNGEPLLTPGIPPGCMGWGGGFGSYLIPVFDPGCGTTLEFLQKIGQPGNQGLAYRFITPPEGCFATSFAGYQRAYPTHEGIVVLQIPGGNLIQVRERSFQFPEAYGIMQREETVTWGFVKIENETHLLPVAFEKLMFVRSGSINRVSAKYVNHRHFEANTSVTFQ